jgi:hypothetical protein
MSTSSLRDELQAIYDQHGELTPALVVDEARSLEHPLHSRFEWDNRAAGEAWRRAQAHELIRSVKIVYRDASEFGEERSVRAFHAVRTDEGHVYKHVDEILKDPVLTEIVRADMQREWKQLKRRFDQFDEFWHIVAADSPEVA